MVLTAPTRKARYAAIDVVPNLATAAVGYLWDMIFSGQLAPGTRLQPLALAEQIGISATPVREALALLEYDGLVTRELRKGYFVSYISRRDIEDLFALDSHLEVILSNRALNFIDDDFVDLLKTTEAQIAEAIRKGSAERVGDLNGVFHRILTDACPDSDLLKRYRSTTWRSRPARFYASIPGYVEATHHDTIIEAVQARDADQLAKAVEEHAQESCRLLVDHLEARHFFKKTPQQ